MLPRGIAAIAAGLLLGICIASLGYAATSTLACMLAAASAAFALVWFLRAHVSVILLCVVFLCGAILGALRFEAVRLHTDAALDAVLGEKATLAGRIIAEPDVRDTSVRLTLEAHSANGVPLSRPVRVLVIAPAFTDARYGDEIETVGTVRYPAPFESGEGRTFNYPMYLATRGIGYELTYAQVHVGFHGGNPLVRAAIAVKATYVRGLRAVLPEPYAGLAAGITAGDKRSVGSDLSETFQRVSLVHILVLSGYNITVVLSMLMRPLSRLSRAPQLALVLATVSFFIVISGGASSAARAAAMAFAAVFAKLYGRRFIALRVLYATVVLMVLWNPYVLLFDPGFQLSVLATLGLIIFSPHVERRLGFVTARWSVRDIVSATLSTQLTVLPLLLFQNGSLSLVALPANVLALIAVPLAMACSAIAALAGMLLHTWGVIVALPAYALLRYIVTVADLFASLPFASVAVPAFSAGMLACMYALIGTLYAYLEWRTHRESIAARK